MRLWIRYSVSDLLMTEARPISTTDRIAAQKKGMWLISAPTTDVTSDVRKGDRNLQKLAPKCSISVNCAQGRDDGCPCHYRQKRQRKNGVQHTLLRFFFHLILR